MSRVMSRRGALRETVVLFTVGEGRFAIAASAVQEVCGLEGLVALAPAQRSRSVRHMLQRRDGTRLVVDARLYFGMSSGACQRLLLLRFPGVAVLVGSVDRMQEITALYSLPRAFRGQERQWFRGLSLLHDGVVPVVDANALVAEPGRMRAPSELCTSAVENHHSREEAAFA